MGKYYIFYLNIIDIIYLKGPRVVARATKYPPNRLCMVLAQIIRHFRKTAVHVRKFSFDFLHYALHRFWVCMKWRMTLNYLKGFYRHCVCPYHKEWTSPKFLLPLDHGRRTLAMSIGSLRFRALSSAPPHSLNLGLHKAWQHKIHQSLLCGSLQKESFSFCSFEWTQ